MSENRSQATPARDSGLTDALRDAVGDNYDHGRNPNLTGQLWHEDGIRDSIDWAGAARDLEREGWSKPRTVNSTAELDALPMGSVVREICETDFFGVLLIPGTFEKFPNGLGWHVVAGHGSREVPLPVTVLFTPGGAG